MAALVPVAKATHAGKTWVRPPNGAFAAGECYVPIVSAEVGRAASAMPIGLVRIEDRFVLVAMLSLTPGVNLFVDPQGQWVGAYVPALLRAYPFRLLHQAGSETFSLWVDPDWCREPVPGESGFPFYGEQGGLSAETEAVAKGLAQFEGDRAATSRMLAAAAAESLIIPWPLEVVGRPEKRVFEGLYRFDEKRLGELADDRFVALRRAGVLPLIYGQLLSMNLLQIFAALARLRGIQDGGAGAAQAEEPLASRGDSFVLTEAQSLRFD
ncbi:MAG: SapC family protein [Reyranellaceae bacterium]